MTTVHVVPLADSFAHSVPGGYGHHDARHDGWLVIEQDGEDEGNCICGTRTEYARTEAGRDGSIVVHRALAA